MNARVDAWECFLERLATMIAVLKADCEKREGTMNNYAEMHFETKLRGRGLPYESEGKQVARLAASLRPRRAKKESRNRRVVVWLGDFVAGLRCRLESRLASEPTATPC